MNAPRAPRRPHVLRAHGDERVDDWYWLRDRDDPDVRAYLEGENVYTEVETAHLEDLRKELYEEIVNRVQETDVSAPVRKGPYEYFTRTFEERQYGVHCRSTGGSDEHILLDENDLAAGHEFFALGGFAVSPDQTLLAYSVDLTGAERYELRFRDLTTAADLDDVVPDVYYGLAWANDNLANDNLANDNLANDNLANDNLANDNLTNDNLANDNRTIFYTRPDEAMRPWQVWRHVLGTPPDDDVLVRQEDDDRFYASVGRTRTDRFVVLSFDSKLTSEVWLVDGDEPDASPRVVEPRVQGVEYHVEHHASAEHGDRLYVLTNADGAHNFKLMVAPTSTPGRDGWSEVVPHRPDVRLEGVEAFDEYLVMSERAEGLERIVVHALDDDTTHTVEMPDPVYSAWVGANLEFETTTLRFGYTSLVAPVSSYDHDMEARTATLVKRQPVRGGYDPDAYETHRVWATAPDGTKVPVSLVHRRGLTRDGSAPLLLYGYGSYEASMDPTFSSVRLSLLERGFVWAVAHVRGGGELGRDWYDQGKLANKTNTFTDFIACAEHLVAEGYTSPDRLVARGGSAGGLLMGAVVNARSDLFRAVVAEVPFVDCLTTILDDTLPLTITEWEEWGNPVANADIYRLMKSYSPYDNVEAKAYPALLVTGGLNDPRVQYWEPAKWVAKLRATKTDDHPLLLKMEMGAGHRGPSGRYDAWRDEAFVLAFVLDQVGLAG